jgi:hypothetical protein
MEKIMKTKDPRVEIAKILFKQADEQDETASFWFINGMMRCLSADPDLSARELIGIICLGAPRGAALVDEYAAQMARKSDPSHPPVFRGQYLERSGERSGSGRVFHAHMRPEESMIIKKS